MNTNVLSALAFACLIATLPACGSSEDTPSTTPAEAGADDASDSAQTTDSMPNEANADQASEAEPEADGASSDAQCLALFGQCDNKSACCDGAECEVVGSMAFKVCCVAIGKPCKEMSDCCGADTFCDGPTGQEVCSACKGSGFDCQKTEDCCYGMSCGADSLCHPQ